MNAAALTVGLCLIVPALYAQVDGNACRSGRYEVGLAIAGNQYFGDLHCSDPCASFVGFAVGIGLRVAVTPTLSVHIEVG